MFTKLKNWWNKHKQESDEEFYAMLRDSVPPATFKYGADGPPPILWEEGKTIIMPRWLKEEWVAALRSGDYTQGRTGALRDEQDKFCCLGVLCAVGGAGPGDESFPAQAFLSENGIRFRNKNDASRAEFTGELLINPALLPDGTLTAAYANDTAGKTFDEIADMIESVVQTY